MNENNVEELAKELSRDSVELREYISSHAERMDEDEIDDLCRDLEGDIVEIKSFIYNTLN